MGKRETTTVPSHALFLMNSDFVRTQSEAMACRLIDNDDIKPGEKGAAAFYLVYGRPLSKEDIHKANDFYKKFFEMARQETSSDGEAGFRAMTNFCHALFASADFPLPSSDGVRFIEITHGSWDQHRNLEQALRDNTLATDQLKWPMAMRISCTINLGSNLLRPGQSVWHSTEAQTRHPISQRVKMIKNSTKLVVLFPGC